MFLDELIFRFKKSKSLFEKLSIYINNKRVSSPVVCHGQERDPVNS